MLCYGVRNIAPPQPQNGAYRVCARGGLLPSLQCVHLTFCFLFSFMVSLIFFPSISLKNEKKRSHGRRARPFARARHLSHPSAKLAPERDSLSPLLQPPPLVWPPPLLTSSHLLLLLLPPSFLQHKTGSMCSIRRPRCHVKARPRRPP